MKGKTPLLVGGFIGVFVVGALLGYVGHSLVTKDALEAANEEAVIQTPEENHSQSSDEEVAQTPAEPESNTSEEDKILTDTYICPITGEVFESGTGMGQNFAQSLQQDIAESLEMTVEELQTSRSEGKTVSVLAEEKGITVDELKERIITTRKVKLEQLVADGIISQEQMDLMMENVHSIVETALYRDGYVPLNPQAGMGWGPGGRWNN
ncbi:hypothetical protein [Bacillus tuaregi]|uniref:hypothetical protein n=1 Tax=Bacillus tuaregi TaxID=1816695 RepID=UPI0008F924F0|nr:hypothetical protein [Bacillus tuaregi]